MGKQIKYIFILSIIQHHEWSLNAQEQERTFDWMGSSDVCPLNMDTIKSQFTKSDLKFEKSFDEKTAEILEQIKKNDVKTNLGVYESFIENTVENKLLNLQAKTSSGTIEAVHLISMILNEKFGKLEQSAESINDRLTKIENLAEKVEKIGVAVQNLESKVDDFEQKLSLRDAAQEVILRNVSAELTNAIKTIVPDPSVPDCTLTNHLDLTTLSTGKYHLNSNKMNWYAAKVFCQKYGMQLVTINSKEEAKVLVGAWKVHEVHWTSANDIGRTPGQFYWADGKPTERWIWNAGQPDDHGEGIESCAYLRYDFDIGDTPCFKNFPLICELHPYCKN